MPLFLMRDKSTEEVWGTVQAVTEEQLFDDVDSMLHAFGFEFSRLDIYGYETQTLRRPRVWFSLSYSPSSYGMCGETDERGAYEDDVITYGNFPSANKKNKKNGIAA